MQNSKVLYVLKENGSLFMDMKKNIPCFLSMEDEIYQIQHDLLKIRILHLSIGK